MTDVPVDPRSDAATPLKAPDPAVRLVYGTAAIGALDEFLADCDAVAAETGAVVQAFDAGLVASATHLREAARLAARSIARGEAIARDPGVEVLLYAAGRRQIDRALEMGVGEGETPAVVLVDGGDEAAAAEAVERAVRPAETLGAYDEPTVREFFEVDAAELEATDRGLKALVLERVALLVVER